MPPPGSPAACGSSPCSIGASGSEGWSDARWTSVETEQRCSQSFPVVSRPNAARPAETQRTILLVVAPAPSIESTSLERRRTKCSAAPRTNARCDLSSPAVTHIHLPSGRYMHHTAIIPTISPVTTVPSPTQYTTRPRSTACPRCRVAKPSSSTRSASSESASRNGVPGLVQHAGRDRRRSAPGRAAGAPRPRRGLPKPAGPVTLVVEPHAPRSPAAAVRPRRMNGLRVRFGRAAFASDTGPARHRSRFGGQAELAARKP